jgi:signal transduction histidine kinase
MRKPRNINVRVLLVALVPALLIGMLLSLYFGRHRFVQMEQALSERGLAVARQLAPAAEFGVSSGNREVLNRLIGAVASEIDVEAVTIRDAYGNVLASSSAGASRAQVAPHDMGSPQPIQTLQEEGRVLLSSAPILQSQLELEEFFTDTGAAPRRTPRIVGRAFVAMSRAPLIAQRERVFGEIVLTTLLVLAAMAIVGVRMSRNIARPLTRLTQAVQRLAQGDLNTRVTPDSDGVIRDLEDGVNTMAAALKSAHTDLERRIAEATAQLEMKKEEAERANRAKSGFLAAASHDLRQPLHALGLFVASLQNKPMSDEAKRLVGQIERSVTAIQDLLDALLDISRLDRGVIVPEICVFPVSRILSAMEANFAQAAHAKGLEFRIVATKAVVRSDPILLERIVSNLVSNAVRHTVRGRVLVGCRRCGTQLRIDVADTGVGIPVDQQHRVFEEFYRATDDHAAEGKELGLGLGLAIVDRLARLLGHAIALRSVPGRGSLFSVAVARAGTPAAGNADVSMPEHNSALAGLSVLVIDDDAGALSAAMSLLESWGCEAVGAGSGAEAESRLSAQGAKPVDLILCDYRLSRGETGVDVLDRLRRAGITESPAIVISADLSAEVAGAVRTAGCPLLHKPLRAAKLQALIRQLLAGRDKGPR